MGQPDAGVGLLWSAGNGRGWPQTDVVAMLKDRFGFPDERTVALWSLGAPLPIDSRPGHKDPVIITCDPQKAEIALLAGWDVAFLPNLMGEPIAPPDGYAERYGGYGGDPWMRDVS